MHEGSDCALGRSHGCTRTDTGVANTETKKKDDAADDEKNEDSTNKATCTAESAAKMAQQKRLASVATHENMMGFTG